MNQYIWIVLQRWRWRWLLLGISSLAAVSFAFLEEYEHILPFNVDLILMLLYGIIIPLAIWWIVVTLARIMAQRVRSDEILARHQRFAQQLEHCQGWIELTRFVVQFPSTMLPVSYASLYAYDHQCAQPKFVAEWDAEHGVRTPVDRHLALSPICSQCVARKSPRKWNMAICKDLLEARSHQCDQGYCLPLVYDGLLIGILRFGCAPSTRLPEEQVEFISSVAPEIALALALSIAQPRQMNQVQIEAQLNERRNLAYDLHHSLAQQASYLHVSLERLLNDDRLVTAEEARQELRQMREITREMYDHIRGNLSSLRAWETSNLTSMLMNYTRSAARKANCSIEVTTVGAPVRLPFDLSQQILGLVREGLTNVDKHAQAHRVQIKLDWSSDYLTIDLVDDGCGFDPLLVPEGHYGLVMMRERANDLGGELQIMSAPGKGTQLNFVIPISSVQFSRRAPRAAALDFDGAFRPNAMMWAHDARSARIEAQ